MDSLYIILICSAIVLAIYAVIFIKKTANLTDKDIESIIMLANTINYIVDSMEIKYSDKVSKIIEYTIRAIEVSNKFETAETLIIKKDIVALEFFAICEKENIEIDEELLEMFDDAVEFIINNNYIK